MIIKCIRKSNWLVIIDSIPNHWLNDFHLFYLWGRAPCAQCSIAQFHTKTAQQTANCVACFRPRGRYQFLSVTLAQLGTCIVLERVASWSLVHNASKHNPEGLFYKLPTESKTNCFDDDVGNGKHSIPVHLVIESVIITIINSREASTCAV